jgi:uncharacterized protein (TIGR00288 family)
MSQERETNLALFIDFDNVALGARDAGQRFDIKLLLQRLLEKGKIIVKKAYADWHYYKEHMSPLHEAAIELIEIPMPKISGKNSADIKLVVDAMDLCYSKEHIDTFVIVSGDSDFSPLVSKLRENNKRVIGIGMKNSSSRLLIGNCDEFIFYDDIIRQKTGRLSRSGINVPSEKRDLLDFLVKTVQSLLMESRGVLYSSLIKDTMTRKQPDFNERAHGYSTFGDLLEEARELKLLDVKRDAAAGGTWVVRGLGEGITLDKMGNGNGAAAGAATSAAVGAAAAAGAATGTGASRSSRRRRRSGRGGQKEGKDAAATAEAPAQGRQPAMKIEGKPTGKAAPPKPEDKAQDKPQDRPQDKPQDKLQDKPATRKAPAKKSAAKKAPAKRTSARKTEVKKPVTPKAPAKKDGAGGSQAPAKKTTRKTTKSPAPPTATRKKTTGKS